MQKTVRRSGHTLQHGTFQVCETIYVCASGCTKKRLSADGDSEQSSPVTYRSRALTELLPPRRTVGYDVMVFVGLERFVHNRQREEIRSCLEEQQGIRLSTGQISALSQDFVLYLQALHELRAPAFRAALAQDGGYPLHIDATGESGRGTLLVAFAGWRRWVLGSWKIPTERGDAILPRLRTVVDLFGAPCAVMRDLGPAVIEATRELVNGLEATIPVLGCHFHFVRALGKDLLTERHDQLRALFRRFKVRPNLRALARDMGRALGPGIDSTRNDVANWLTETASGHTLPSGTIGLGAVRLLAQWALDYPADGNDEGFPFDLPYLDLWRRCHRVLSASEAYLRTSPRSREVRRAIQRLHRIVEPVRSELPFERHAKLLERRARLLGELRETLRLRVKPTGHEVPSAPADHNDIQEQRKVDAALTKLTESLRRRRPKRGPAQDTRQAIDVIIEHLDRHGSSLVGRAIPYLRLPVAAFGSWTVPTCCSSHSSMMSSTGSAAALGGRY